MESADPQGKRNHTPRKNLDRYLRYSGMAFQMLGMIGIAAIIGHWLDGKLNTSRPWFTLFFIVLFFGGYMYKLYIDLNRKKE